MPAKTDDELVLVLAPIGRDAELAVAVLGRAGYHARACASPEELCLAVETGAGCALITEETLTPATARRIGESLERQPPWSDFPLIAFSASKTGRSNAAEALRHLGNVVVLDRPVQLRSLLSAVDAALRGRRRQYEGKRAIEQRDQFLAMLGHELRNPLGAILFASQLMANADEKALSRHRTIVDRQARHLARLVDDLLDVSRVTSGKVVLQRSVVDLRSLVERCIQATEAMMQAQDQTLTAHYPPHPVLVDGDPVRLEQVVSNLITNASKYTSRRGHLEVELAFVAGHAELCVRDNGIGIEPALLGSIFELFTQAPGSLDRSQGGLGLGLTLVRSLVTLHGGTVSAASEGAGKGSQFTVRLPARTQPAAVPSPGHDLRPAAHGLRVVVVDDNADLRETLEAVLESYGHSAQGACDGMHGLAAILGSRPDVAIIDIGLPGLNGYQLAAQVRASLGDAITLVALTGYGQPEDRARATEAGFDVHLTKPVTGEALVVALTKGARRRVPSCATP